MSAGLVKDQDGMSARVDLGGDFIEMPLPGLGVAAGQDKVPSH